MAIRLIIFNLNLKEIKCIVVLSRPLFWKRGPLFIAQQLNVALSQEKMTHSWAIAFLGITRVVWSKLQL